MSDVSDDASNVSDVPGDECKLAIDRKPWFILLTSTGSAEAKKAFSISLVRAQGKEVKVLHKFHPAHVYSIFGDDEQIYGYQDLRVDLSFNSNDMRPNLSIKYTKKLKPQAEVAPADIEEVLRDYLPEGSSHPIRIP